MNLPSEVVNHYVVFRLGEEVYGLDVANAREIVQVPRLTPIPSVPDWIRGVVNLRGSVVPVIDLKMKFNMGRTEVAADSCVLIVEFLDGDDDFVVGVLADHVLDVLELGEKAIEPPPKFGARFARAYLRGLARRGNLLFVILDAAKVFADANVDLGGPAGETTAEEAMADRPVGAQVAARPGGADGPALV
jgi:purine-binding chemotaxis protein CheW